MSSRGRLSYPITQRPVGSLCLLAVIGWSCSPSNKPSSSPGNPSVEGPSEISTTADWTPPSELASCANSHAVPNPEFLPKSRWQPQLQRMAALIEQYQLGVPLTSDELTWAIDYYTENAPESLPVIPIEETLSPLHSRRTRCPLAQSRSGGESDDRLTGWVPAARRDLESLEGSP